MKNKIKNRFNKLLFLYDQLGTLKKMFWVCILFFILQALWEGVIITSFATLFQSLIDSTNYSGGQFEPGSIFEKYYHLFKKLPYENKAMISFIITSVSFVVKKLIDIGVMTYRTKFSTLYIYRIRKKTFQKLIQNNMTFFDNNNKGILIRMVVNETRACYSVLKCILDLLIATFTIFVFLYFIVAISVELSIIVTVSSLIFLSFTHKISKIVKKISEIVLDKTRKLTVTTEESIGGMKQIKLLKLDEQLGSEFNSYGWKSDFANRKAALLIQWQTTLSYLFGLFLFFTLVFINFQYSLLAASLLLTYLYLLKSIIDTIAGITSKYGFLKTSLPATEKIISFFQESEICKETSGTFVKEHLLDQKLIFKKVCMDYGKGKVLNDISFEMEKGKKIAIVGASGAGKTSMINLITRLYDPISGEILIDGKKIQSYDLNFLRNKIRVVNQDTILFNKTIKENILMGSLEASEEEMINASKNAFAHDFIMSFPEAYDTVVGDRGVKLSGGQRQRLNIAQIFLKKRDILILDEATSALDTHSEKMVHKAIDKLIKENTCMIIAHRLSTIKNADIILVLNNGRIAEKGSWSDLMKKNHLFYKMVDDQSFSN
ncbi:MAG: ABC transporter ATP-binding protein [Desulfobacterales bacterium]|nr:ABC transporter ATP-binding protein [Desulfobacterales bacterium]